MNNKINYFDGEYLYKSYNVVPKIDKTNLVQEAEKFINAHWDPTGTYHPPKRAYMEYSSASYAIKELSYKKCWNNLLKNIFLEVNNYYKNYLNSSPILVNFWVDKTGFYSYKDTDDILYFDNDLNTYTDSKYHFHKKNTSTVCVFYLQNPNKRYGTLVKTKNGSLVLDGTENSLSIFNSRLFHTAVYPNNQESGHYPRYSIGLDFRKKFEPILPDEGDWSNKSPYYCN